MSFLLRNCFLTILFKFSQQFYDEVKLILSSVVKIQGSEIYQITSIRTHLRLVLLIIYRLIDSFNLILYLLTDPKVEEKADLGFYWV